MTVTAPARTCEEAGCDTILSTYNDDPRCWQHRKPVEMFGGSANLGATRGTPVVGELPIGPGIGEQPKTHGPGSCSVCGKSGHNIRGCPEWKSRNPGSQHSGEAVANRGVLPPPATSSTASPDPLSMDRPPCEVEECPRGRGHGGWHWGPNAREANAAMRAGRPPQASVNRPMPIAAVEHPEGQPDSQDQPGDQPEDGPLVSGVSLRLATGGPEGARVELLFSGNVLALCPEDRDFLFGLADAMQNYERTAG